MVMSEVLIGLLKGIYSRARPLGPLVTTSGPSFPSGHAVAASVTAVAAVIALVPAGRRRAWWAAAAVAFSILMGLSRAYLGAHWLSDAAAGILLGTSCALVTALVAGQAQRRRTGHRPVKAEQPAGVPVPERQARRQDPPETGPARQARKEPSRRSADSRHQRLVLAGTFALGRWPAAYDRDPGERPRSGKGLNRRNSSARTVLELALGMPNTRFSTPPMNTPRPAPAATSKGKCAP
jgi:hypothetical protein